MSHAVALVCSNFLMLSGSWFKHLQLWWRESVRVRQDSGRVHSQVRSQIAQGLTEHYVWVQSIFNRRQRC